MKKQLNLNEQSMSHGVRALLQFYIIFKTEENERREKGGDD